MLATHPYANVLVLILTVMAMVVGILTASQFLGPKRRGRSKTTRTRRGCRRSETRVGGSTSAFTSSP